MKPFTPNTLNIDLGLSATLLEADLVVEVDSTGRLSALTAEEFATLRNLGLLGGSSTRGRANLKMSHNKQLWSSINRLRTGGGEQRRVLHPRHWPCMGQYVWHPRRPHTLQLTLHGSVPPGDGPSTALPLPTLPFAGTPLRLAA